MKLQQINEINKTPHSHFHGIWSEVRKGDEENEIYKRNLIQLSKFIQDLSFLYVF